MGTPPKLEFNQFSDRRTTASRAAWQQDVEAGLAFPTEIDRLFDWVGKHQEVNENEAVAYGVFPHGGDVARGICEVIFYRKSVRSKWIKLLKLTLKPGVDAEMQDGDSDAAIRVFTEAMIGAAKLQLAHNAHILKVYGRTNEQLNFLKALVRHLEGISDAKSGAPYKATIEGRFLTIAVS